MNSATGKEEMMIRAVVFDIGQVLVRWDPYLAWEPELGTREAVEAFLKRVDFFARNVRADAGELFTDLAKEIDDAGDAALFLTYLNHYERTVPEKIEGTWALKDRLKQAGYHIHGITNWAADTWPVGLKAYPELGTAFEELIVSGQVGMLKPEKRIFDLMCERTGLKPGECLFIDDSATNVEGAKAAGWDAVQFTTPDVLEKDLIERGLL